MAHIQALLDLRGPYKIFNVYVLSNDGPPSKVQHTDVRVGTNTKDIDPNNKDKDPALSFRKAGGELSSIIKWEWDEEAGNIAISCK
jgi:hypothetical protein